MTDIRMESPKNGDWDWIMEKHAETAWSSLPPLLQTAVPIQTVRDSLTKQTTELILAHGKTNQVFVARGTDGQLTGYVWVEEVKSGFTGAMQAYILNLYVAEEFRGRGIGARLMDKAEGWARENQYHQIRLSVAFHNTNAVGLYKKLGYEMDLVRMFKELNDNAG